MLMSAWKRQKTTGTDRVVVCSSGIPGCESGWKRCSWAMLVSIQPNLLTPPKLRRLPLCPAQERMLTSLKICNLRGIFYTSGHEKCLWWVRMLKMKLCNQSGNRCAFPSSEHKVNFSPVLSDAVRQSF